MSHHTYRVTEIVGTSPDGIDARRLQRVARAAKTLRNLDWFEVTEIRGHLEDGRIAHTQVTMKVGFRLDDDELRGRSRTGDAQTRPSPSKRMPGIPSSSTATRRRRGGRQVELDPSKTRGRPRPLAGRAKAHDDIVAVDGHDHHGLLHRRHEVAASSSWIQRSTTTARAGASGSTAQSTERSMPVSSRSAATSISTALRSGIAAALERRGLGARPPRCGATPDRCGPAPATTAPRARLRSDRVSPPSEPACPSAGGRPLQAPRRRARRPRRSRPWPRAAQR